MTYEQNSTDRDASFASGSEGAKMNAKFSPGQMSDKAVDYGKTKGAELSRNLASTIRNNPVPAVFAALGVAWLLYSGGRRSRISDFEEASNASYGVDPDYEYSPSTAEELKQRAAHFKDSVKGRVSEFSNRVERTSADWRNSARHAGHEIRDRTGRAGESMQSLARRQPFTVSAVGIAVGALIAAALWATNRESGDWGETRDRMASKAKEKMQQGKQKVNAMGESLSRESTEEKREEEYASPYGAPPSYAEKDSSSPKLNS